MTTWPGVRWVVLWSLWAARLVRQPTPAVHLPQGALRGQIAPDGSHYQYFGIPYATSQQKYRFQAPGPAPSWAGTLDAIDEHVRCGQRLGTALVLGREDCLVLNVYSPRAPSPTIPSSPSPLAPVMVFIHGGGFQEGSGNRLLYGPDYLVARDVVLVTFNYRLGVHGFLCLRIKEAPGNAGLKDQVAALKWVQSNIKVFGGDPDNVTIFGESAGGVAVSFHLQSPMSRGLFHKAIAQSGSSLAGWALQRSPLLQGTILASTLGHSVKDAKQLYNILMKQTFSKLVTAEIPRKKGVLKWRHLPFRPCLEARIEGVQAFITDPPFHILSEGNYTRVPVMLGANDQEGYYFTSFEDDESLNGMKFEDNLPDDLEFPTAMDRQKTAQLMKQLYMSDDKVTWDNIMIFSKLIGEPHFNYPMLAETELLLQTSNQSIYSYLFEYAGWRNFPKLISGGVRYWLREGAAHADELFYLFSLFPIPTLFENNMINIMTKLWTNFAKYGNPGSSGADEVSWRAAVRASPQRLVLGARPHVATTHAHRTTHMQFWADLYRRYRYQHNFTQSLSAR